MTIKPSILRTAPMDGRDRSPQRSGGGDGTHPAMPYLMNIPQSSSPEAKSEELLRLPQLDGCGEPSLPWGGTRRRHDTPSQIPLA